MTENIFRGREWYREFKEQDHEHGECTEEPEEEIDLEECPYCEHNNHCPGGCQTGALHHWKFEKKEEG